jgi:RNA polymerase sigma-70 factor, ECF subfamily
VRAPRPEGPAGEIQLLGDAARGDEHAAAVLYERYADALYGYGLRRLHDQELAEELVQRVLEKAWRRAGTYDPTRGQVGAFLFAIAASTVRDLQRRRAGRPLPVGELPPGAAAVDDEAEQVLLTAVVRAAMDRLTPDHRRVLELAYHRGLSQREIAATLGLPLGTVKSRTYYALRMLRLACEELGVSP